MFVNLVPAPTSKEQVRALVASLKDRLHLAFPKTGSAALKPAPNRQDTKRAGSSRGAAPLVIYDGAPPTKQMLLDRLADAEQRKLADAAAVVMTSGSTGEPSLVGLSTHSLVSSAQATHRRLGGTGTWVAALPFQHVAGLQVLVRSATANTTPVTASHLLGRQTSFDAAHFMEITARTRPHADRLYTSLVTKMVVDLLDAPQGAQALQSYDAVLVGGGPVSSDLRRRCANQGINLQVTYGMTETAGGCVYNGIPLDGTNVKTDPNTGRILLSGTTLMNGYLDQPAPWVIDEDGTRWLQTSDVGRVDNGRLEVLGRVDDIVNSGGHKVSARQVEQAIRGVPEIEDAYVFGEPDEVWGQRVVASVVLASGLRELSGLPELSESVRRAVRSQLPAYCVPRTIFVVSEMPRTALGKVDGGAVRALLRDAISQNRVWQR